MPVQSRWTTEVPEVSLPRWVFSSPSASAPTRPVFIDAERPERTLNLAEFRLLSQRVARGLQKAGLQPGDRVLLCSPNSLWFPCIFMGIIMAGGIFTGASPAFGPAEFAYQLGDCGARFVLAQRAVAATASAALARLGWPAAGRLFVLDDDDVAPPPGGGPEQHWTALLAPPAEAEAFAWAEPADPRSATCCLNYSSGTTGLPKGVEVTHYAYVANGEASVLHRGLCRAQDQGQGGARDMEDRELCFMPLYHAAAQTTFAVNCPRLGTPVYIMPAYSFEKLLACVQRHSITALGAAPPILLSLSKSPLVGRYDLGSLRAVTCGTAPLPPEVAARVEDMLWPGGGTRVRQGWGMTEITCIGSMYTPGSAERTSSVGEIAVNAAFRLTDGGGADITRPRVPGDLWFSGPALMKGYWRNPRATAEAIVQDADGTRWLRTGDVAYVDKYEPGAHLYIVDRAKELIKVRGFQVAPAELEALLLEREDVVDAGVVGVVINGEEVPRAYVVRSSGVTEDEIARWVEGRVAKYKRLRGGVCFVDAIPRIPSGKILRRELRDRAKREVGSPTAKLS